jgi:hypothetical protein
VSAGHDVRVAGADLLGGVVADRHAQGARGDVGHVLVGVGVLGRLLAGRLVLPDPQGDAVAVGESCSPRDPAVASACLTMRVV